MTATEIARAEWLEWRQGGITATDVAKIMGLSPWGSPWTVWADKVGLTSADDIEVTDAMEFGTRAEKMLGDWFHERTGMYVLGEQTWSTHPVERWARATIDGFAVESVGSTIDGALGGVEFKTSTDSVDEWSAAIPAYYLCQVQWQMYVTGLPTTWVPTLHMAFGRLRFHIHQVERDEADIELITKTCRQFWHDHVLTGEMPAVDGSNATTTAIGRAWPDPTDDAVEAPWAVKDDIDILRELKLEAKAMDAEISTIENRIKAAMGECTAITNGFDAKGRPNVIATWKAQERTSFDHKAALAADPTLERFQTTTTSRVLRLKTPEGN